MRASHSSSDLGARCNQYNARARDSPRGFLGRRISENRPLGVTAARDGSASNDL